MAVIGEGRAVDWLDMASDNTSPSADFRSVSGQMETAEPAGGSNNNPMAASAQGQSAATSSTGQRRSPSQQRQASSQSTPVPQLRKQPSSNLVPLSSPSAGNSPHTSRNTSPIRRDSRPQSLSTPISTQPSAAAIQRALSAANVPQLPAGSVTDAVSRLPRANKSTGGGSGDTTPQWPVSPRLKSPPPPSSATSSRRASATTLKKVEVGAAPSISVQGPTPQAATPPPPKQASDEPKRVEQQLQAPAPPKTSSRGPSGKSTLETVQENSADTISVSPAAVQAAADIKPLTRITEEDKPLSKKEGSDGDKHTQPGESGSESAGSKIDQKRGRRQSLTQQPSKPTVTRPATTTGKSSYAPLTSAKSRQSDGKQNMTVETETVASIPTSALNAGDRSGSGRNDPSGSVRLKPSNETIRPKKERKKPSQKARSINQGTGMLYTSRSRLLVRRDSFGADAAAGGRRSARSSSSNEASGESTATTTPRPKRRISYSSPWQRAVSFGRPSRYIRTLSDKYLRKASSKADIFEARVASAVDEANTSDSDETFVYESNPPEAQRRPRHHSRTPSVTSSHSTADQQRGGGGIRNFGDMLDERRVAGKRSMKFSNNPYTEVDSPESKNGGGTVRSSHQPPRHYGKFGRGGGGGGSQNASAMLFAEQDSPFTQASKLRSTHWNTRHSRPNSPRSPQSLVQQQSQQQPQLSQQRPSSLFTTRKHEQSFDFDGEGADDERTPLIGTVRTHPRTGNNSARHTHRRVASGSGRSLDEYYGGGSVHHHRQQQEQRRCGRLGGCVLGFCVLVAVVLSAAVFLVMSNQPMYDVRIRRIENVLASEQEIMLDLLVGAVNPNALGVGVGEMDVSVFAKSKFLGGGEGIRRRGRRRGEWELERGPSPDGDGEERDGLSLDLSDHWHTPPSPSGGVDEGTDPDPPTDLPADAQTMLLGRIFHFDQALSFEGSPIKRHAHFSVGELRLMRPGNQTEVGGSARWEQVLKHPFELIVRGVLRYRLPVSGRGVGVRVGGSVVVVPEEGGVEGLGLGWGDEEEMVDDRDGGEHWDWAEWRDEVLDGERVVEVGEG